MSNYEFFELPTPGVSNPFSSFIEIKSLLLAEESEKRVPVPAVDIDKVTEGGKPAVRAGGVVFVQSEPAREPKASIARAVYEVGSGTYQFRSTIK